MLRRMHYCMEIYTLGTIGHGHMYYMYSTSRQPKALTMGSALLTWTLVLPVLFFIKFFESAACILTNQTSMQISRNELLRKVLTMMVFLGGVYKKRKRRGPSRMASPPCVQTSASPPCFYTLVQFGISLVFSHGFTMPPVSVKQ